VKLTSLILLIATFLTPNKTLGQEQINFLELSDLTIKGIYKILKHDIEDYHSNWTYYSERPNYLTAEFLEISNHRSFYPVENYCYQTRWFYVDKRGKRNNYININDGAYVCKEPPSSGSTSLNKLTVKKLKGKFYIEIFDSNNKLKDKFEIKAIEFKVIYDNENAYKIKLNRMQL
jgi:hypothetical protein